MRNVRISPSLLSADFADLGAEVRALTAAGADLIHLDVMDGHFVPSITFGAQLVRALRPHSDLPFDVHLMVASVDRHIDAFIEAGADILTIHPEAGYHLHRSLERIRDRGRKAGVALNPGTPAMALEPVLDITDLVLVMSVNPGYAGQAFLPSQLDKLRRVRALIDQSGRDIALEVDGGITHALAPGLVAAGADILVAGSATFCGGREAYAANIRRLKGAG